ncbi:hypothetical protein BJX99DRAFT_234359 [Aspergillus californicus]
MNHEIKLTLLPNQLWQTVFKTHSFHIDLDSISKEWREFLFSLPSPCRCSHIRTKLSLM